MAEKVKGLPVATAGLSGIDKQQQLDPENRTADLRSQLQRLGIAQRSEVERLPADSPRRRISLPHLRFLEGEL